MRQKDVEKVTIVNLFDKDSPFYQKVVFAQQLVWKPWRVQQARTLIPLGFTDFIINGIGDTVAKMDLTVHGIPVRVSYIVDTKELSLSIDDRPFAHILVEQDLGCQEDVIDKVMEIMIDCDLVKVSKKE